MATWHSRMLVALATPLLFSGVADAAPFFFSTGDPDGRMASASRPDTGGVVRMHLREMPQLPLDKEAADSLNLDLIRDNRMPGRGRSA